MKKSERKNVKTKKLLTISSIVLLLFLSGSAIYGGLMLMIDPSGVKLGLPSELLNDIPFRNFFIPGLILFVMNGLFSLMIAILTFKKVKYYDWLILFQGCVLAVWLTVELVLGIFDPFLHYTCYSIAVLLIIMGILLIIGRKR
ncbi:hypothetical protein HQ585_16930 [candidate division KSB1 bacterium]|nr:hypothetical protein [candidate division KSB1 bacterium]